MDIPASLSGLVGETVLQLATSYDATKFFLDIPRTRRQTNYQTRFGFALSGARLVRSDNVENLLGRTITSVYDGGTEGNNYRKVIFETNPTGREVLRAVLYFELLVLIEDAFFLMEDGSPIVMEDGETYFTLESFVTADLITFASTTIPRNILSNEDADTNQYIVQEDNFKDLY